MEPFPYAGIKPSLRFGNVDTPLPWIKAFRRPGPRAILLDGKRNTVSTIHVILEIGTAAPQGIEIRVSERIWWCFFTSEATSVNISWNFRTFGFCIWPWICKISCQNKFPGHGGPTNTTNESPSTNWRSEIKIYRADLAQFTQTWPRCPKIRFAFFMLRRPWPRGVLLTRTRRSISTRQFASRNLSFDSKCTAGGQPPTWLPPGRLVERLLNKH